MVSSLRFSLREHKIYAAYNPVTSFTKPTATELRIDSSTAGLGRGYAFVVVPRTWLNGKYIRWCWDGDSSWYGTLWWMRIYDGVYNRTSDTDFPSGSDIPSKGAGLLQEYTRRTTSAGQSFGPETIDVLVDVSDGTEDKCTIFFGLADAWSAQWVYLDIDWFEINGGAGGADPLYDEQFTDDVHMEKTGTYGDYGYISAGEIVVVVAKGKPASIIPLMRVMDMISAAKPWSKRFPQHLW